MRAHLGLEGIERLLCLGVEADLDEHAQAPALLRRDARE